MEDWTDKDPHMIKFMKTLAEMNQYIGDTNEFIAICEAFKQELENQIEVAKGL
jgi:hypothetical protein